MQLTGGAIILSVLAMFSITAYAQPETQRSVSYGCSGGFTGGGGGVTVRSNGTILKWSLPAAGASVEESVIRSDPTVARRLFTQLDEMHFTNIDYKKFGNMTCYVTLREGSNTHSVSWATGDTSVPPPVTALSSDLERLALPIESK
jgi:hypothetical protein